MLKTGFAITLDQLNSDLINKMLLNLKTYANNQFANISKSAYGTEQ